MKQLAVLLIVLSTAGVSAQYAGVSPDSANAPPNEGSVAQGNIVTWLGFQPGVEGGRVFIQVSGNAEHLVTPSGSALVVTVRNARVHTRTNRLPLDASFFNTAVRTVRARTRGADVAVEIALKRGATPRVERVSRGRYTFILVTFPGSGPARPVPAVVTPRQAPAVAARPTPSPAPTPVAQPAAEPAAQRPISDELQAVLDNPNPTAATSATSPTASPTTARPPTTTERSERPAVTRASPEAAPVRRRITRVGRTRNVNTSRAGTFIERSSENPNQAVDAERPPAVQGR